MGAADDGSEADEARRQDELAKKLVRLSDDKRQSYQAQVDNAIDRHGTASHAYRLSLVNTYSRGLPPREEALEISEHNRNEQQRAYWNSQGIERERATSPKQHGAELTPTVRDESKQQTLLDDPMAGVRSHGATRNYGKLQETHEQVAAKQNAGQGTAAESATAVLSKQQLHTIAQRCAETRKAGNLEPTPAEIRERNELTKMQTADQEKFDRTHGPAPNEQQKQQFALLDHQQLAERVGAEARSIGQHLRRQGAPGAGSFEHDARRAHHTARLVHEQRQNLGAGIDRTQDAARVVQQQEQHKSAAQEAARGGSTLTSEQRANASPDVQRTLDRKDRADAIRNGGTGPGDRSTRGNARPGNSRPGRRSR